MARRRTRTAPASLFAWNTLGLRWLEMMNASSQVFAHRTGRNNTPEQLFHIGNEKVQAGVESSLAMAKHLQRFPVGNGLQAWDAWMRLMASGMAPYHRRATRNARSLRAR